MHFERSRLVPPWILIAAFALTLTFTGAAAARAQPPAVQAIEPGHFSVTPFIGVGFGGDIDGGALVGVSGAFNWDGRVSFEGDFSLLPSAEGDALTDVEASVWNFTANVLYHFAERPFIPYVAAGVGIGHASVELDLIDEAVEEELGDAFEDSSTGLIFNFGGGVKRQVSDRASFRGDLRYFTGNDFVPAFLRLYAGLTFDLGTR